MLGTAGSVLGVVVINVDLNGIVCVLRRRLAKGSSSSFSPTAMAIFIRIRRRPSLSTAAGVRSCRSSFPKPVTLFCKTDQVLFEARDGAYAEDPVVAAFISRKVDASTMEKYLALYFTQPLTTVLERVDTLAGVTLRIVLALGFVCLCWRPCWRVP